ncbi:MAG: sensor histidine kinase [Firmicutes bacterium]|nr:sensor histidine kinase [Bacillota bacterium]
MLPILEKLKFFNNPDLANLLSFYRYLSLLITSAFYLARLPNNFFLQLGVCSCLFVEAYVFIKLYNGKNCRDIERKLLILLETFGLAYVLSVTGGMASPFLWYVINPILLSATLMPTYYCWLMMINFSVLIYLADRFSLYTPSVSLQLWPFSTFIIILSLITLIAQLYTYYFNILTRQQAKLEKQLQHIKSLYQAAEAFSHLTDPQEVISLFASYVKVLCSATKVIIWVHASKGLQPVQKTHYYTVRGPRKVLAEDEWYPYVKELYYTMQSGSEVDRKLFSSKEAQGTLITVPIHSHSQYYGIFSTFIERNAEEVPTAEQTIIFLADLCAVALEKYMLNSIADEYLLTAEKDRIAGEIHDSVTQNLFGLVYGLGMLSKEKDLKADAQQQLKLLQKTAQTSLKELRAAIYTMSSLKKREEPLLADIQQYLKDFSALNKVNVSFHCNDIFPPLGAHVRHALYRIIREATGNAIRHGLCERIDVDMKADQTGITLTIADDGCGFNPDTVGKGGLGLINMKELTRSVGGVLTLSSSPQQGTVVKCVIPAESLRKEMLTG